MCIRAALLMGAMPLTGCTNPAEGSSASQSKKASVSYLSGAARVTIASTIDIAAGTYYFTVTEGSAVSSVATFAVAASMACRTWTMARPFVADYREALGYGNGAFVALTDSGFAAFGHNAACTSDGKIRRATSQPYGVTGNVVFGTGERTYLGFEVPIQVFATGGTGSIAHHSEGDAHSWVNTTLPYDSRSSMAYGNGTFVAVATYDIQAAMGAACSCDG